MTPIDWNPTSERLRRFGLVATVVFAYAAWLVFHGSFPALDTVSVARGLVGRSLVVVALGSFCCSLVLPRGNRLFYVLLTVATRPLSIVISTLVLAAIFFGVVAPIGALRRLFGADPLKRRIDPARKSYWVEACPSRPPEDYFKLF
jgi:hypothetical protein